MLHLPHLPIRWIAKKLNRGRVESPYAWKIKILSWWNSSEQYIFVVIIIIGNIVSFLVCMLHICCMHVSCMHPMHALWTRATLSPSQNLITKRSNAKPSLKWNLAFHHFKQFSDLQLARKSIGATLLCGGASLVGRCYFQFETTILGLQSVHHVEAAWALQTWVKKC